MVIPVLAIAGFFIAFHLGKPERGILFPFFFKNYDSWLVIGGWTVGLSIPLVAVYAAKTFGIAPEIFSGLQVELLVHCVTFVTYNNNNNTYKYIVFFIDRDRTYNGNRNNIYIWIL